MAVHKDRGIQLTSASLSSVPSPSLPQGFRLWDGTRNQAASGSPSLGMESLCPPGQAVGLAFFSSMVATYRAGRLSQGDARRFVTGFLKAKAVSMSSRPKRGTGQCGQQGRDAVPPLPWPPNRGGWALKRHPTCCWTSWARLGFCIQPGVGQGQG